MKGVAHINGIWGLLTGVCSHKWELQCLYVYIRGLLTLVYIIPLITYFPDMEGVCWEKCELQCLCVCIIPLITYFPNMEGVAHRNEKCNVYVYIIPLITYFPDMDGVAHRN